MGRVLIAVITVAMLLGPAGILLAQTPPASPPAPQPAAGMPAAAGAAQPGAPAQPGQAAAKPAAGDQAAVAPPAPVPSRKVFRWIDRDGVVHYSDSPQQPDAAAPTRPAAKDRAR